MGSGPAYTRLPVDERRQQLIDAGAALFAQRSYEEISMQDVARAAGVSKALLYHYFPSKTELFKAAVAAKAHDLQVAIDPTGDGTPLEQLARSLDAYLTWIEANATAWSKLMQSATALPEARELVQGFREQTLEMLLKGLTNNRKPRPLLLTAIKGWLGYMDAAILDWAQTKNIPRDKLRDLLIGMLAATLHTAHKIDPKIDLQLDS
jgi:AcrR family transcriptional regulator